ncbi:Uncharacterised protein [Escherichia coli]|nr:Uncharacterised protein [Escherichia coli]VVZ93544.1 Uncharacterised protein [Escherichia coli]
MPVHRSRNAVYLRGRCLLIVGERLIQAVYGCLVAVDIRLQAQQRARRCLLLVNDYLINTIQLRTVTGDRRGKPFACGHLRQPVLDNGNG